MRLPRPFFLAGFLFAAAHGLHADDISKVIKDISKYGTGGLSVAKALAKQQAKTGVGLRHRSKQLEQLTFAGKFTPPQLPPEKKGKYVYGLAILSDDGCNVTVRGQNVFPKLGNPQHLPDMEQSFAIVPALLEPEKEIEMRVDYKNVRYTARPGHPDIDGVTVFLYLLRIDIDVATVAHNAASGVLGESEEESSGAFAPLNSDDDDYSATLADSGSDKDQAGAVTGENDLLPIYLRKIPQLTGAKFLLDTPPSIKVWKKPTREDQVLPTTELDATADTTLYAEGVNKGSDLLKLTIRQHGKDHANIARVKITVFELKGVLNVPGYAAYTYTADGALPRGSKWGTPTGGTLKTSSTAAKADILWNQGPVVGKAVYKVNGDYVWDLEVNVVQIKIKAAGNEAKYPGFTKQLAPNSQSISSNPAPGVHAMTAKFTVELVKGPTVGAGDRGVKFMEMGQIHLARFTREHAKYNNALPKKIRTSPLEGFQGGSWIWDPGDRATIPWTFRDPSHYLRPVNDAQIPNINFDTFDGPQIWFTDMTVFNGDTVDRSYIYIEHVVYFAIRTVQNVNSSEGIYTQRLQLNWHMNGDGVINNTTGVWSYQGPGDGVDGDAKWSEIRNGSRIPKPATNDDCNTLLSTIDNVWIPKNQ